MQILQVSNGFPPTATAGVEQYTYQLSRALRAQHSVSVFCRESDPQRADYDVSDETHEGIRVRRVVNDFQHALHVRDFYLDRRIEAIFRDTLAEWQPDIIHFQHCIGLSASLPEVARGEQIPHLLTLHDYWYLCSQVQLFHRRGHICGGPTGDVDCYDCIWSPRGLFGPFRRTPLYRFLRSRLNEPVKRRILSIISRIIPSIPPLEPEDTLSPFRERTEYMLSLLGMVPKILVPSRFVRDIYVKHGVPGERVTVLPLGLDLSDWHNVPRREASGGGGGPRVGYIGTFLRHKGVHVLMEAFHRLESSEAALRIHGFPIPGDPYIDELRRLADRDPRIHLMGRYQHRDLRAILNDIDVVVIPSLWNETFSIVAREALLSGAPVIASEVGALPEIIRDGKNGCLVPPGDVSALHAALADLLARPDRLLALREGARESRSFVRSIGDHAREIELVYQDLRQGAAPCDSLEK